MLQLCRNSVNRRLFVTGYTFVTYPKMYRLSGKFCKTIASVNFINH